MRRPMALALVVILAGCMAPPEDAEHAVPGPAGSAPAAEPGLVLRGCERHYTFTAVPSPLVRPLVPEEFSIGALATHAQVSLTIFACAEVAPAEGASFGPASLVLAQVRIGDVPEDIVGPGITWYRVFELTDNAALREYMVAQGIPVQAGTFARQDLGTQWSFRLDIASEGQDLLTLVQQSDTGEVFAGSETEDDRVLSKVGDGYVWTQNNATMDRGYVGTGQVVPHGGEALALFGGGVTAFIIPGGVEEGQVGFGSARLTA